MSNKNTIIDALIRKISDLKRNKPTLNKYTKYTNSVNTIRSKTDRK